MKFFKYEGEPVVNNNKYKYTFSFNTISRIRYIVFRLSPLVSNGSWPNESYTINDISVTFYPMGYNYNKLNYFNLYKYGPFIKEYNSNADRIVNVTSLNSTATTTFMSYNSTKK